MNARELPLLQTHLDLYSSAARSANSDPLIQINAHDPSSHQRVIDVLNTIAAAGIHNISFTEPAVNPAFD